MDEMRITRHAQERMVEMGITEDEVRAVLAAPEISYPAGPGYNPNTTTVMGGRLALIVDPRPNGGLITVLWRTYEQYERAPKEVTR